MEVKRKQEILNYLAGLGEQVNAAADCVAELLQQPMQEWQVQLDEVASDVASRALYVPVVGSFSTGKSTALNSLLGRRVLPENVSPETAIPAELHFSGEEMLMALSHSGEWSQHSVSELASLSENAHRYQVVRIYLNNPALQQIEPLVLVDMPGFDSGLNQHNEAILRYITTGALYLYLVDSKSGTVSRQDTRRIEEILDIGRAVKVFLTKSDLASVQELDAARTYVSEQLSMISGDTVAGTINKDDVSALLSVLNAANVPELFDSMILPQVKNLYFDADGLVNTAIKALSADTRAIEQTLEDAERALKKVEAERVRLLEDAKQGGVSKKSELVINRLEKTLRSATDELTSQARLGEESLAKAISDLVRSTLTVEIQSLLRKSVTDITYSFSGDIHIGSLSVTASGDDWMGNLISVIESEAMNALSGFGEKMQRKRVDRDGNAEGSNMLGNMISSLSSLAIYIPHPVLKVVFAILPGIIGQLFSNLHESNETGKLREAISAQVIPAVIAQVRPQVLDSLNAVEAEIVRLVSEQVTDKVNKQKTLYENVTQCSQQDIEMLRTKADMLKAICTEMKNNANGVIV
ncbi:MAG: hypothetical protein COB09_07925 [Thalassobium sp.]|nr:MAG: hypothetical protein COB09_07925 [Thalassobium sp.]